MGKYRKKPVIVEAWQWTGKTFDDARRFSEENGLPLWTVGCLKGMTGLIIPTLEGDHVAQTGDYIIKGVSGEYYPCKPDIFEQTYEPVDDFDVDGLICPDCGRHETVQFDIGDECICGGYFVAR